MAYNKSKKENDIKNNKEDSNIKQRFYSDGNKIMYNNYQNYLKQKQIGENIYFENNNFQNQLNCNNLNIGNNNLFNNFQNNYIYNNFNQFNIPFTNNICVNNLTNIYLPFFNYPFQNQNNIQRKTTYNINNNKAIKNLIFDEEKNENKKKNNKITNISNKKNSSDSYINIRKTQSQKYEINIEKYEIEEFKSYLNSLITNLSDFLCTQKGVREVQKYINKCPNECKTILINSLNFELPKVMMDVYGNYFCQDLIKKSNNNQINLIIKYIKNSFVEIAFDYSGTHVLQVLLDMISTNEEENILINSVIGNEIKMSYDINATHVLQKMIVVINENRRSLINENILKFIKPLCLDANGICLIKKFISNCVNVNNKKKIINCLTENCLEICQSPFGNYVIQFILEEWGIKDCLSIVNIIIKNICMLSIQKFSSNVSEKILSLMKDFDNEKKMISNQLFFNKQIMNVLKNKYGRYVLQKAIKILDNNEKENIYNHLLKIKIDNFSMKDKIKYNNFIASFEKL